MQNKTLILFFLIVCSLSQSAFCMQTNSPSDNNSVPVLLRPNRVHETSPTFPQRGKFPPFSAALKSSKITFETNKETCDGECIPKIEEEKRQRNNPASAISLALSRLKQDAKALDDQLDDLHTRIAGAPLIVRYKLEATVYDRMLGQLWTVTEKKESR